MRRSCGGKGLVWSKNRSIMSGNRSKLMRVGRFVRMRARSRLSKERSKKGRERDR